MNSRICFRVGLLMALAVIAQEPRAWAQDSSDAGVGQID